MALNKNDITTIVNNYRNFIGSKAIPNGFDLKLVETEVKYLEDMLSKSQGDQLPINSPIDIQKVSRAVGILNQVNQFEEIGGFRKKVSAGKQTLINTIARTSTGNDIFKAIGSGVQAYNTGKNVKGLQGITAAATATELDQSVPVAIKGAFSNVQSIINYSNYRTIRDLKELFGKWTRGGGRVQLPMEMLYDLKYQASHPAIGPIVGVIKQQTEDQKYYFKMMQALPKEEQIRLRPYVDSLSSPQKALDLKTYNFTNAMQGLIQRLSANNADKGMYVDNTIITLGDLSAAEMEALGFIEYVTDKASEYITSYTQDFMQSVQELQAIERQMKYIEQKRSPEMTEEMKEKIKDGLIEKSKTVPYDKLTPQEKAMIAKLAKEKDLKPGEYYNLFIKKEDQSQDPELLRERELLEARSQGLVEDLTPRPEGQSQMELSDKVLPMNAETEGDVVIKASLGDDEEEETPTRIIDTQVITPINNNSPQFVIAPDSPNQSWVSYIDKFPNNEKELLKNELIRRNIELQSTVNPTALASVVGILDPKFIPPYVLPEESEAINVEQASPAESILRDEYTEAEALKNVDNKLLNERLFSDQKDKINGEDVLRQEYINSEGLTDINDELMNRRVFPDKSLQPNAEDVLRDEYIEAEALKNIDNNLLDQRVPVQSPIQVLNTSSGAISTPEISIPIGKTGFFNYLKGYFPKGELPNYEALLLNRQDYLRMAILKRDPLMLLEMPSVLGPTELEKFGSWAKFSGKKLGTDAASGVYDIGSYLGRKFKSTKVGNWFKKKYLNIRLDFRKYYKDNRKQGLIGFVRNVRKFIKVGKKDEDGLALFGLKELFKSGLTAVIERVQKFSGATAGAIRSAQKTGLIPKSWANLSSSVYQKLEEFAKNFKTAQEVKQVVDDIRQFAGDVRKGFAKVSLIVDGLTGSLVSISTIVGPVLGGLPIGGISGAIILLTTGSPVAAIGVGLAVAASNSAVNILGHDYSSIIKRLEGLELRHKMMMGDPLDGFSGPRNRQGAFSGLFRSVNLTQLKLFNFIQGNGWGKTLPMLSELSPSSKVLGAFDANGGQVFNRFSRFSRFFNSGITTGSIAIPLAISAFGLGPGLLIGGAVTAGSMGLKFVGDNLANSLAGKGSMLRSLAAIPLWDTFNTVSDIWQFQMEMMYIKNKYGWDIGKYFEGEFRDSKNWSNWIERFETLGRISNLIGGPSAVYGMFTRFMPYLSRFFTFGGRLSLLPRFVAANAGWVALGTGLAFAGALLLGVPLGPMAITFGLIGGIVGGIIGIGVGTLATGATWGFGAWSVPIFATGFSFTGSALGIGFGGWLDNLLGNTVNRVMSLFNAAVNGLQALFSLLMIWKQGINFKNVIQFMMSLITVMSALEFYQSATGTNSCTTDQECPVEEGTGGFLNSPDLSSTYLRYYNVRVVSDTETQHQVNIARVLKLLEIDGQDILNKHQDKEIYIYVTDQLNDVYTNSEILIIATTSVNLYQADSFVGLINNLNVAYSE